MTLVDVPGGYRVCDCDDALAKLPKPIERDYHRRAAFDNWEKLMFDENYGSEKLIKHPGWSKFEGIEDRIAKLAVVVDLKKLQKYATRPHALTILSYYGPDRHIICRSGALLWEPRPAGGESRSRISLTTNKSGALKWPSTLRLCSDMPI